MGGNGVSKSMETERGLYLSELLQADESRVDGLRAHWLTFVVDEQVIGGLRAESGSV